MSKFLRNKKEVKNASKKQFPSMGNLKCIHLDFEHFNFTINDIDIGHCTDLDIAFHNKTWTVSISSNESFTTKGENVLMQKAKLRKTISEAQKTILVAKSLLKE